MATSTYDSPHAPTYGGYLRVHVQSTYHSPGVTKVKWWVTAHGRSTSPTYLTTKGKIYIYYVNSKKETVSQSLDLNPYEIYYTNTQVGKTQTFYTYHYDSGKAASTIIFSNLYIWSSIGTSKLIHNYANNKPYTKCGTPSSVSIKGDYAVPGEKVTVTWGAGTAGTSNDIQGYRVRYRWNTFGKAESSWQSVSYYDINTRSHSFEVTESERGKYLEVAVRTIGSIKNSDGTENYDYSSDYTKSVTINTNIKPLPPKLSVKTTLLKSNVTEFSITITAPLKDQDRRNNLADQSITIRRYDKTIVEENRTSQTVTDTCIFSGEEGEAITYVYYTYDGYEYSDSASIKITRNIKPTVDLLATATEYEAWNINPPNDVYITQLNQKIEKYKYIGKVNIGYGIGGWDPNIKKNITLNEKIIFNENGKEYTFSEKNYKLEDVSTHSFNILNSVKKLGTKWRIEYSVTDTLGETSGVQYYPIQENGKIYYYIPETKITEIYNQHDNQDNFYANNGKEIKSFYENLRLYYKTNTGLSLNSISLVNNNNTSEKIAAKLVDQQSLTNGTSYVDLTVSSATPDQIYYPILNFKAINASNNLLVSGSNGQKVKEVSNLSLYNLTPSKTNVNVYTFKETSLFSLRHIFNGKLEEYPDSGKKYFMDNNLNPTSDWLEIFLVNPKNKKEKQITYTFDDITTNDTLYIKIDWSKNNYEFAENPLEIVCDENNQPNTNTALDLKFKITDTFGKITTTTFSKAINYIFITNSIVNSDISFKMGIDKNYFYDFKDTNWLQQNLFLQITNDIKSYNVNMFTPILEIEYYKDMTGNSAAITENFNVGSIFKTSSANKDQPTIDTYQMIFKIPNLKSYPYCKLKMVYIEKNKNYRIESNLSEYIEVGYLKPVSGVFYSEVAIENNERKNNFIFDYTINNLNYNTNLINANKVEFYLFTSKTIPFENSSIDSTSTLVKSIELIEGKKQNKTITTILPNNNVTWDYLYQGIKTISTLTQIFSDGVTSKKAVTTIEGYTLPCIVYNLTPTIAYRKGALGINSSQVTDLSILDINPTNGKYKITFNIPGTGHLQGEISLGNGEIDGPEQCFLNLFTIDSGEW